MNFVCDECGDVLSVLDQSGRFITVGCENCGGQVTQLRVMKGAG